MTDTTPAQSPSLLASLFHHIIHMPTWHRHVLTLAALVATVGAVGHVRQYLGTPSSQNATAINAPSSGFTSNTETTSTDATANQQPWYLNPRYLSIGGSVLGGFLIGWLARAFIKTVVLLSLAGAAILGGLSYFHVINVDFTSVNQEYSSAMSWLMDQASRLKDVAIAHLPVHASAAVGAFLGFRRK